MLREKEKRQKRPKEKESKKELAKQEKLGGEDTRLIETDVIQ